MLRAAISSPVMSQFILFTMVGCLNVGISTIVFYLCYEHWHIASVLFRALGSVGSAALESLQGLGIQSVDGAFSTAIGYTAGMLNSYVLNKSLTFGVRSSNLRQILRFILLNILGLIISTFIMFVFVDIMRAPYMFVWVSAISIVMVLNFLGNKYWTFAKGKE